MKQILKPNSLPLITMGAGGLGLVLRIWYFSTRDARGLLASSHFANTVCYLLFAAMLAVILLCVRQLPATSRYQRLFPAGKLPAIGAILGCITILISCIVDLVAKRSLAVPGMIFGLVAIISLMLIGLQRMKGDRPPVYLFAALALYLVIHALLQTRLWSKETQVTAIFFPLLASLCLLMCAYFHAHLSVRNTGLRRLVFFHQASLFLCCMSLNSENTLFYLGMALWLGCDLPTIPQLRNRREES